MEPSTENIKFQDFLVVSQFGFDLKKDSDEVSFVLGQFHLDASVVLLRVEEELPILPPHSQHPLAGVPGNAGHL